jgi:MoxR-like ATPase
MNEWEIFVGSGRPSDRLTALPPPPPWRVSSKGDVSSPVKPNKAPDFLEAEKRRGEPVKLDDTVRRAINASLFLRRPLLVTGKPGVGKSALAYAVAYELRMGPVLSWPITSRTTVKSGLYSYDAVGRLQSPDKAAPIGQFLRLGPLGTALYPTTWPRTLLIDEIDKGDIDLPNDLLTVLEDGCFEIDELARASEETVDVRLHGTDEVVTITRGQVESKQFPFIVMTSNGEREFPAPFLRRCIRITIPPPKLEELQAIVKAHLEPHLDDVANLKIAGLIKHFLALRDRQELATDQLLNAVYVVLGDGRYARNAGEPESEPVIDLLLKQLSGPSSS